MHPFTVTNIGELITLDPLVKEQRFHSIVREDLGVIRSAWLAIDKGKVADFGSNPLPSRYRSWPTNDAGDGLVMPGLVDCHTHPIFGGNRAKEFSQRLTGTSYQEIAKLGGGIQYTVRKTREAGDDELLQITLTHLERFKKHGVTTVEAKSGYGLSVAEELRLLRILNRAKQLSKQHLSITCLALHAVLPEASSTEAYVESVTSDLLPQVQKEKLADWVDAFVEEGYFTVDQVAPYIAQARKLGFAVRIHADEFTDSKGGAAAARWHAKSADHLECTSVESIKAMAKAGTVAVILPGTSLYTGIPYTKAKPFIKHKCPVALATDFNPGSCQVDNLPFIATIGAIHARLTLAEAVGAVTLVPAFSLNLHNRKGALSIGHDADFLIYDLKTIEEWIADLGQTLPKKVYITGHQE